MLRARLGPKLGAWLWATLCDFAYPSACDPACPSAC